MIRNTANGKVYDGSSVEIERRWQYHKRELRNKTHFNPHLQSAWNKYGESSFEFSILEECIEEVLIQREKAWIKQHNSMDKRFGYNINDPETRVISQATRDKISKAQKGKHKSAKEQERLRSIWIGRKHTPEAIENMKIAKALQKMLNPKPIRTYKFRHSEETKAKMREHALRRTRKETGRF